MQAKYHMTREENIFVAKRNIIDYIWKSARLEGLAVTYPDTEAIYNGMSVQGVKVSDIVAVNNLKHAWQFILDTLDYPIDYPLVCKINQCVGGDNLIIRAGYLHNMPVSIGGTTWKPDMPIESQIKEEMAEIAKIDSPTDRALTLMLYLVRKQMFLDGNKRTSMLAGNHVMISNGCGIISVPIELQPTFTGMLIQFYESNDMREIKQFLYENCVDGIEFEPLPECGKDDAERNMDFQAFKTNIKILDREAGSEIRERYIENFINTSSSRYYEMIQQRHKFQDGYCYLGYLWDYLKNPIVITREYVETIAKDIGEVYVFWDIQTCERIFIKNYWKLGKDTVIKLKFEVLLENYRYLPEDIYIFDETFQWTLIFTHEEVDGVPYCVKSGDI